MSVPVLANGDIKCEADITRVVEVTGVDGEQSNGAYTSDTSVMSVYIMDVHTVEPSLRYRLQKSGLVQTVCTCG